MQSEVIDDDYTWKEKLERVVMEIPLHVSCRLSEPTVSMNKLLQTRTGDIFPIYVGEGIEVLIEDQLVFQSELGELSGQAAVNIKKRLSK